MHIEPGIVNGVKMLLSYGTAAVSFGVATKFAIQSVRQHRFFPLLLKSLLATLSVLAFFELLPRHPVGVSEVHLILGSSLFLIFGLAPAAIGLIVGLLLQGIFFSPFDLPQYAINITTLLMPLFAMAWLAKKIIPADMAYQDLSYGQTLKLSAAYQGGIISWVAFWAVYGNGLGSENLIQVGSFCLAYLSVILVEPLIDLGLLTTAKSLDRFKHNPVFNKRLFN